MKNQTTITALSSLALKSTQNELKTTNPYVHVLILLLAIFIVSSTACTRDQFEEFQPVELEQTSIVTIEWTAFKFPTFEDRVGVSGTFDSYEYKFARNANNILDQLDGAEITIPTSSINVGNSATKTANIATYFFPFLASKIDCEVKSIDRESAEIAISINDVTVHSIFEVNLDEANRTVKMSGGIEDLMVFGAQKAFKELNMVCGEYHDGFVWPDVTIEVTIEHYDLLND